VHRRAPIDHEQLLLFIVRKRSNRFMSRAPMSSCTKGTPGGKPDTITLLASGQADGQSNVSSFRTGVSYRPARTRAGSMNSPHSSQQATCQ
jgi:hypothetical protein